MKNLTSLLMIFVFTTAVTYGNFSDNGYAITYNECDPNKDYALVNCPSENNYLHDISTNVVSSKLVILDNFDREMNEDLQKINAQQDHLNDLLKRKRLQYQLHKTKILGQLTSPANSELKHPKLEIQKIEGFGIRLRF